MKPPRVLLLTTYYHPVLGGVETHARQLARHLAARGADVRIITKRVSRTDPVRDEIDGVPVRRVGPVGDRRGAGKWIALPSFLLAALEQGRDRDVFLCVDYRGIGIAAIAAAWAWRRPAIVQAGTAGVLAAPDAETSARTGVPEESAIVRMLKAPARAVYRHADAYVCIARDIEREAIDAGIPRERVHYLPHGVDRARFHPAPADERAELRRQLGWRENETIVLFVGRLSTEKGVLDLLDAWHRLRPSGARLVLVGPDMPAHPWDAGPRARAFVEARGLGASVTFAGASADPSPLYRAADLFVQPSQFEAFGISVIEAMASGLPVVASEVGGMRDFLVDGVNALLHPARDPERIADALGRALADPGLRSRLAAESLKAAEQFDETMLLDRYYELILQTMDRGSKDPRHTDTEPRQTDTDPRHTDTDPQGAGPKRPGLRTSDSSRGPGSPA